MVSLLRPNDVWASDLRALSLDLHLFLMFVMCGLNDSDVSYVTPSILGVCVCGIGILFMVSWGMYRCSCVQLVRSVAVDLVGAILSLFVVNQWWSVSR